MHINRQGPHKTLTPVTGLHSFTCWELAPVGHWPQFLSQASNVMYMPVSRPWSDTSVCWQPRSPQLLRHPEQTQLQSLACAYMCPRLSQKPHPYTQPPWFQMLSFSHKVRSNCHHMNCSPPGSVVHRISQARILEWVAISFSGIFLTQGSNPYLLHWQEDSLPLSHQGSQYSRYQLPELCMPPWLGPTDLQVNSSNRQVS